MNVRYDDERGVYRDCKWCRGKGCVMCPTEADAEYKRQFPNGPEPLATFPATKGGLSDAIKFATDFLTEAKEPLP
jgi:hypothetical protein